MEKLFPVKFIVLYFDNGIEYVNHLLAQQFGGRKENKIEIARGRAGKKNDQCHIEQKNNFFYPQLKLKE
jgi:hypothetical protein